DSPLEARAEHQVSTRVQCVDKSGELVDRVGPVRIRHDDEVAARLYDACEVSAAVAAPRLEDDGRAVYVRDRRRPVAGAVVDDDHLAGTAGALESLPGLADPHSAR